MAPKPTITSKIKPTHILKVQPVQVWQYTGQPTDNWPDWVLSAFRASGAPPRKDHFAIRDQHGYLEKWLAPKVFADQYKPLA